MTKHVHEWKYRWVSATDYYDNETDAGYVIYCNCGEEWAPEDLISEIMDNERLCAIIESHDVAS